VDYLWIKLADEIPSCTNEFSGYVGNMNFLPLVGIMAIAAFFVWRSSGKKSGCGRNCNCAHDSAGEAEKKNVAHKTV
jgi:hypothetical protein